MGCGQSTHTNVPIKNEIKNKPQIKNNPMGFKAKYKTTNEVLGSGTFGVVKMCTSRETGEEFAVKVISRYDLTPEDDVCLRQEIDILKSLQHPYIVQAYDFFEEEHYYFIVMELIQGGELFDRVVQKASYSERDARDALRNVIYALEYMHKRNIVHRDLKPENILLASKYNDIDVKLADFGFATNTGGGDNLTKECGTLLYMAPEIIKDIPYGVAVDMWSIGAIAYILLSGIMPFADTGDDIALAKQIMNGEYNFNDKSWDNVTNDAKDFVMGLLNVDPKQRLTATQALKHKWMNTDGDKLSLRSLNSSSRSIRLNTGNEKFENKFRVAAKAVMATNRMMKGKNDESHMNVTSNTDETKWDSSKSEEV